MTPIVFAKKLLHIVRRNYQVNFRQCFYDLQKWIAYFHTQVAWKLATNHSPMELNFLGPKVPKYIVFQRSLQLYTIVILQCVLMDLRDEEDDYRDNDDDE